MVFRTWGSRCDWARVATISWPVGGGSVGQRDKMWGGGGEHEGSESG